MAKSERPAYSVTSLAIYERCPWLYYVMYIRRVPPPRSPARDAGTAIHKLIADHLRQKRLLPTEPPDELRQMLANFLHSRFNLSPVLCETPFTLHFEPGDVRGRIDTVLPRADGGMEVVDFKSGSVRSLEEAERGIQLPLYALAVGDRFDLRPAQLSWTYFYLQQPVAHTFQPNDTTFAHLTARVEDLIRAIQAGRFDSSEGCGCWACRRWPPRAARSLARPAT
jgi:DNA helicase-2/ATP-dependent DNA helicase PcrA